MVSNLAERKRRNSCKAEGQRYLALGRARARSLFPDVQHDAKCNLSALRNTVRDALSMRTHEGPLSTTRFHS